MGERTHRVINAHGAPAVVGPYCHAQVVGDLVICSGMLPTDPATGTIVSGGLEAQTHRIFANIVPVLEAAGSDLAHVVKTTVFLRDMGSFAAMNAIYASYFKPPFPARSAVEVSRLPLGAEIEIEMIARLP